MIVLHLRNDESPGQTYFSPTVFFKEVSVMLKIYQTKKSRNLPEQISKCQKTVFLIPNEEEPDVQIPLIPGSESMSMFRTFWNSGSLKVANLKLDGNDMPYFVRMLE